MLSAVEAEARVWVSWSLDWVRSGLGQNAAWRNNWGQLFYSGGARVTVGNHRRTVFWELV